ncbi:AAA family ATPase, partial [Candidatus Nitrosopelagicus sp.]|nr:AAA family ATPase [Candidatus Nitrosopelagicus sp.]
HGLYTIEMGQDGKTYAAKDGKIIGENSESRLLEFLRNDGWRNINKNYQPVLLKMLLENKDKDFFVSYEEIRKKFDELNFDTERFKREDNTAGFGSSMDSVRDSNFGKRKFIKCDSGSTKGGVTLNENEFNHTEIPEILKICGQKIAQWHIDNIADDELQVWRVLPGNREEGFRWKDEFRETNTIGVDYGIKEDLRPAQQTIDDVKNRLDDIERKRSEKPFSKKGSVTAITHKIKPKDIIVLTKGQKEVIDFGIVTSEYFFDSNPANKKHYSHRRKVVWLNQGPLPSDVGDVGDITGYQHAVHEIDGENGEKRRKAIEILTGRKEEKYFLLRHAVDGPWKDDLGKKYHIGRKKNGSMGNLVQEIRDAGVGTKTVWWTASGVNAYFWGYGTVSKIETITEDKDWNLLYDDFKMFEGDVDIQGRKLKEATETVNQHIHDLEDNSKETGFAWRQSINRIPKKLYEEITSDRSHMSSSTISDIPDSVPYAQVLNFNKNLILYGPPGTGKTYKAIEAAKALTKNQGEKKYYKKVTFHPSYSYEDFVEGFRPNVEDDNSQPYVLDDGIFKEICDEAKKDSGNRYVLLIDEINRGNIPKIFGELITFIENGYRGPDNVTALAYSKEKDNFYVPENLYIIGTMNTADKSLVQMDEALRRRFVFEELMPEPDLLEKEDRPGKKYKDILENINKKIVDNEERMKQFRDRQIGHSYFWKEPFGDKQMRLVIKYQIIPLLQDYFYDDYEEIKRILGKKIIGKDNRPGPILDEGNEKDLITELRRHLSGKSSAENENEEQN